MVYLSFKYQFFCELYFKVDSASEADKKTQLITLFSQISKEVTELAQPEQKADLVCNYLDPNSQFVFKINAKLRKVRFIIRK